MAHSGAGRLRERVTFQLRGELPDGFGNEIAGDWTDQFSEPASLTPRLGGEDVIASRLQGVQPYVMRVRLSSRTRRVTPAWRAYDDRAGRHASGEPRRVFNILSIANTDEKGQWLDLLVSEGRPG